MKAKHYCNILAKFATSIILIAVIVLMLEITTFRNVDVTFAYPPPQSELGKSTDPNPYPAPGTSQTTFTNEISSYPPPIEATEFVNPQIEILIPEDRIVAVRNDGRIVDFNDNILRFTDSIYEGNDFLYTLPTYPNNQNNPIPLRIIGGDDRFQIYDTTVFPWSTVVKINGQWDASTFFNCTGWMVGESAVVTAGHCVYNHGGTNTFAYNVTVTPGCNTDSPNSTPFGSCTTLGESVPSTWFQNGDMGYDYGIYELACKVGQRTGNLGFKTISGDGIGTTTAVTGYPGDKGGTTMWSSLGSISSSTSTLFYYDNDMKPGQSGGPAWDYSDQNCDVCVVAVNANEFDPPTLNNGSRVTSTAFNYFLSGRDFTIEQIFLPLIVNQ